MIPKLNDAELHLFLLFFCVLFVVETAFFAFFLKAALALSGYFSIREAVTLVLALVLMIMAGRPLSSAARGALKSYRLLSGLRGVSFMYFAGALCMLADLPPFACFLLPWHLLMGYPSPLVVNIVSALPHWLTGWTALHLSLVFFVLGLLLMSYFRPADGE